MTNEIYSPSEVDMLLGLPPELQRSFRHRGAQLGSAAVNGRWKYSNYGVLEAAVFLRLHKLKEGVPETWRMALWITPIVAQHIGFPETSIEGPGRVNLTIQCNGRPQFAVFPLNGNPIFTDDPGAAIKDLEEELVSVIDVDRLTRSLPGSMSRVAQNARDFDKLMS